MGAPGRIIQSIINRFGYKIVELQTEPAKANITCPELSQPDEEIVKKAKENFANELDISPECNIPEDKIKEKIDEFFWHYPFKFNPGFYAESNNYMFKDIKGAIVQRYNHIFPSVLQFAGGSLEGKSVLDCGCNCGFWSIQAIRNGAKSVAAFDASEGNIAHANFIKELIGLKGVDYRVMNVFDMNADDPGKFDIVFYFGILYHINKPVEALARLRDVTSGFAVVDTSVLDTYDSNLSPMLKIRTDIAHEQNYCNELCMYPSANAVYEILKYVGFKKVWYLEHRSKDLPENYLKGSRRVFIAEV